MKWIVTLLFVVASFPGVSQAFRLQYSPDTAVGFLRQKFTDRDAAQAYIREVPSLLLARGYLAASVDSISWDSTSAIVNLYTGDIYRWGNIELPDQYKASLLASHSSRKSKSATIATSQVAEWQEQLLDELAANGHPFAKVSLDSVTLKDNLLYGKMTVDEGPEYKIDSVQVIGKLKLKPNFIYPYLHLKPGMLYQQPALDNINQRIAELTFAEALQPYELEMLGSGSIVNLYLQPRRSNIINALIGISPVSTQTPGNKLLVSGEVNLVLRNSFSRGELLGINWEQLQYKSPRINLQYQQPYLFGSQAGVDFAFDLLKKDTQYVNLNLRIGIPYDFTGFRTGKVFFQQLNTIVSYIDTNAVKANRQLPDLSNVTSSNLGLEYQWNTTDYRPNPRKGFEWVLSGIGGIKRIKKNNTVLQLQDEQEPDYKFGDLYDTVKLKTYQLRLTTNAAKYFPTGRLTVLKLAVNGGLYQSQNYYRNELFQIGGSKLLRGFDEESIFARSYAVATAEFRLLTGRNAYFFAFSDGGYAGYRDQATSYNHTYISGGFGLALEAKSTVINLTLANGKRNDLPFELRQSKIHLGFINYF